MILKTILTPSFWGTIGGITLAALGYYTVAGVLLVVVGWGCGIALQLGVEADRDPWRVDTVFEAIFNALRGKNCPTLVGLLAHLPQAILGIILLRIG